MNVYKVIFAKNEVISCDEVNDALHLNWVSQNDRYHYEHDKGQLIYALIQASSEHEARSIAGNIIKEVSEKVFGTDFVH